MPTQEHSDLKIGSAATSTTNTTVPDYSVDTATSDASEGEDVEYINSNWSTQYGYYMQIPELKKAIDSYATWVVGKGWEAEDSRTQVVLDHISGNGKESFKKIIWNMQVIKKAGGDSFAEIIWTDDKRKMVMNLKPLDPGTVKICYTKKGILKHYKQVSKNGERTIQKEDMFHLQNDRISNECHGISVIDSCQWVIDARNEAMTDYRKVLHRNINPLKIIEADTDDTSKIASLQTKCETMIKDKEFIIVPKGTLNVTIPPVPIQEPLSWIKYLESFFYQAVGVPQVILGGSNEFTESGAKISYLTFDQVYYSEQQDLIDAVWNQLFMKITLVKPASLKNDMISDENKDGQAAGMNFQPNDTSLGEEL